MCLNMFHLPNAGLIMYIMLDSICRTGIHRKSTRVFLLGIHEQMGVGRY